MHFEDPEKLYEILSSYDGKIIIDAYKFEKNRKKVLVTISLTKKGEIEKSIAIEANKDKIPTLVKLIEDNWDKIVKEQHPRVIGLIDELKKENL